MVSCFITALYDPLLHCHRATFFFLSKAPHVTLQQRRDFIFPLNVKEEDEEEDEEEEDEEEDEEERANENEFVHALFATR